MTLFRRVEVFLSRTEKVMRAVAATAIVVGSGIGEDVRLILGTLLVHISRCKIEAKCRLAKYSRLLVEPYEIASVCDMQLPVAEFGKIFLLNSKAADQAGCIRL